ncbi:hypothetical protein JVU11DRAFT_9289 [Chiua virens]|nr:hypothetical protein JVU11DRAFT_9289 [Chiua virens]
MAHSTDSHPTTYIETPFTEDAYVFASAKIVKPPMSIRVNHICTLQISTKASPANTYVRIATSTTRPSLERRFGEHKDDYQIQRLSVNRSVLLSPVASYLQRDFRPMTDHLTRLPAGPACLGNMPPPPVPTQGPSIDIPFALAHFQSPASRFTPLSPALMQSQLPASPSLPPNSGYRLQHFQYAAQRDHWARVAYRPPPAETISLEISALYENGSKRKGARGTPLGVSIFASFISVPAIKLNAILKSICEGLKDIPAIAPAAELVAMALEMIMPRIKAYDPRFAWREHEFVVRAKWVDLSRCAASDPYFYADCLHQST